MTEDEFHMMRGKAVQAFADLEHGLFTIFSRLTDMNITIAGAVYEQLATQGKISATISLATQAGHDHVIKLCAEARKLTKDRNYIVHHTMVSRGVGPSGPDDPGGPFTYELLAHDETCKISKKTPSSIKVDKLSRFIEKCDDLTKQCTELKLPAPTRRLPAPKYTLAQIRSILPKRIRNAKGPAKHNG